MSPPDIVGKVRWFLFLDPLARVKDKRDPRDVDLKVFSALERSR